MYLHVPAHRLKPARHKRKRNAKPVQVNTHSLRERGTLRQRY
jgi:hypothetical protein